MRMPADAAVQVAQDIAGFGQLCRTLGIPVGEDLRELWARADAGDLDAIERRKDFDLRLTLMESKIVIAEAIASIERRSVDRNEYHRSAAEIGKLADNILRLKSRESGGP